jgi:N-acetylneuraminate synthase
MEDATLSGPWSISENVFFSGDIGINHSVNIRTAKQLINMAKNSGCDAVKFQKSLIDIVYSQEMLNSPHKSPCKTTARPQKEGLEFGGAEYAEIDRYWY